MEQEKMKKEGYDSCPMCEGTGFNLDFYLGWLRECIKNKTRDFDPDVIEFAKLDDKIARDQLILYIKKGVFNKENLKPWRCPKCGGKGIVDWVTRVMG
jgi:hypothetical protein